MNTYIVEGGIGKQVAFTAIINKLRQRDKSKIRVYSPYYPCFMNNPDVDLVLDSNSLSSHDPRILESDNIIYFEPYKTNFSKGDMHLIQSFCELTGVEYSKSMRPKIYTSSLKEEVAKWKEKNNIKKFILLQFTGGQSPLNNSSEYVSMNFDKNYPMYFANYITETLKKKHPDIALLDCTLPNEPSPVESIKCDIAWPAVHELMKEAEGWIGIDSCVNHFSASTGIPGVVVWGNTRWTQFGYTHNKNLTFHQKKEYNDSTKTDILDPRNIMVAPELVLEVFEKYVMNKPVEEVFCASSSD